MTSVLVVDNYDSFVFNLVQYLGQLGADVVVRRNDELTADEPLRMGVDGVLLSVMRDVSRLGLLHKAYERLAHVGVRILGAVMAGITDPPYVADPFFLTRWLAAVPGATVELACHPGHHDPTLIGRDSDGDDQWLKRRVDELALYRAGDLPAACRLAGFRLAAPADLAPAAGRRAA